MAESILVTGKKISSMELVTNVTGNEKIPTGQPDDLAITPNQLADYTIARGSLVNRDDLLQVEVDLGTQITDLESDVTSSNNSIRGLIAAEEAARIAADNLKVDKDGSVSSVAGRVGDVVLAPSDVLVEGFGSQEDVNKYVAKPFLSGYTYGLGERVVLASGEVVKSTVEDNVSNPNDGMAGWVSEVSDSLATTVQTFNTPEAGVDTVTGVADGAYFNVRSSNNESYIDEYQNVGGSAVATGKAYPSDVAIQNVANYTALPFKQGKTYALHQRVTLDNGDIVQSIIQDNPNNPNEDLTGWYNPEEFQRLLNFEQVSFTTLGIIPNTGDDLTLKINQALIAYRNLFIPNGDYLISSINIPANTVITTQGRGVRFIQKAASGEGTRVIKVVGSNVYLHPSISVKGNIATDPNEQNHAIYIQANATTGHINNVNIGDVYAEDIRGDAVYFGQATGAQYKLTNVTIGNVSFDNVYRNGVSVVSCNGFNIKSVVGKRVGMMDIDIEANIGSGVCVNGYIGFVKGKCIGGIAQTQTDFVDNVIFDRVELSYTDYVNSTPEYPSYYKIPVLYRNIKSMTINELIIDGCDGYAISRIEGDAPLANTPLRIGKLTIKNACKVSNAENGIIKGGHVVIDYLDLDFSGLSGRSLFYAGSNWVVNKADVNFAATCNLFRASNNSKISRLATKSTALGGIFNGGTNGVVEDSTANVDRIFGNATKGLMINCNFTAVTPFAGGDNHTAINTDINGSYYANGLTQYGYLNCLRMGVFHLWVAADGKLRIKSGAPTSDTDGTIVGTQV